MGFSIGSLVSDLTDPGKLVGDLANSVLPSNMKAVGDILGGITDINAGNPLAALSHLTDALKDLPQLLQSLQGAAGGAAGGSKPAGTAAAEPTPPPARPATPSAPADTTTPSAPAATTTPSSAPATSPSTPSTTETSTPAPTTGGPSPGPAKGPMPSVSVTSSRGATVTQVDDGTNTTRVTQRADGLNTVVVMSDATGKTVGSYTGMASNVTVGGEHVNIAKRPGDTLTTVDNGTNTATVDQSWTGTTISTKADALPTARTLGPGANVIASAPAPGAAATAPVTTLATLLNELKIGIGIAPGTQVPAGSSASKGASSTSSSGSAGGTSAATTGSSSPNGTSSASSSGSTSGAAGSSGSTSATPTDLKSLMALSPDQFEQAVTSGKIPDDVANSQSAMMQVQARMNQISQMNQLVTGMMAAMHQMQMSIIQNIRC